MSSLDPELTTSQIWHSRDKNQCKPSKMRHPRSISVQLIPVNETRDGSDLAE